MTKKLDYTPAKILLRVTPVEMAAIQKAAAQQERSVNQWCRLALRQMANKYIQPINEPVNSKPESKINDVIMDGLRII
jgi:uncharacterized protein (DUF1778 family)